MPFALFLFGSIMIVAAIRGKQDELFELLRSDFTGSSSFLYWIMAIAMLVALGTITRIKPVTDAFLILIVLAIVLANGKNNLFDNLTNEIKAGVS